MWVIIAISRLLYPSLLRSEKSISMIIKMKIYVLCIDVVNIMWYKYIHNRLKRNYGDLKFIYCIDDTKVTGKPIKHCAHFYATFHTTFLRYVRYLSCLMIASSSCLWCIVAAAAAGSRFEKWHKCMKKFTRLSVALVFLLSVCVFALCTMCLTRYRVRDGDEDGERRYARTQQNRTFDAQPINVKCTLFNFLHSR